jgi:hypothetical protein
VDLPGGKTAPGVIVKKTHQSMPMYYKSKKKESEIGG